MSANITELQNRFDIIIPLAAKSGRPPSLPLSLSLSLSVSLGGAEKSRKKSQRAVTSRRERIVRR
jgi:hypothetical protein